MPKIRIPADQITQFKSFCKQFAVHFEKTTGVRLRGNNLLNLFARAAGHESYTALLIDAGTYGNGGLSWESIPNDLSYHISISTGVSTELCLQALSLTLRKVQQSNLTVESEPTESFGSLFADSAEIEWGDAFSRSETPLIDLTHLESDKLDKDEKMSLCKLLANDYKKLPLDVRSRVVISGTNETIKWFLDASGLDTSEIEKIILKQNPSIKSRLVNASFASSDISQLEGASESELSAIAANTRFRIPLTEVEISDALSNDQYNSPYENGFFSNRANGMLSALLPALIDANKKSDVSLSQDVIIACTEYTAYCELMERDELNDDSRTGMKNYIESFAEYDPNKSLLEQREILKSWGLNQAYLIKTIKDSHSTKSSSMQ